MGRFVIGLAGTLLVTGIAPYAVAKMGAAAIPVFVVVTIAGVVLCLCLAELAAMMPHRTGGIPSYAYERTKISGQAWPGMWRALGVGVWAWLVSCVCADQYDPGRQVHRHVVASAAGHEFTPIHAAPITTTVMVISIIGLLLLFILVLSGHPPGSAGLRRCWV